MKNRKLIFSLLAVLALAFAAVGFVAFRYYTDNRMPNFGKESVLYVRPDMTASQVIDSIAVNSGVKNIKSLQRAFNRMDVASRMAPGRYVVKTSSPSIYVARMLVFGWQTPLQLTLSGSIRSKEKIARQISNQMMVGYSEVYDSLCNECFLARYGTDPVNLFGLIIPDSYQMYWTAGMDEIFSRLKAEYDAFWTAERLELAAKQGLTQREVSTLASIVSGETRAEKEYPVIAGVYLNRLHMGMKLQADPTVCFCFNYEITRVLRKHLEYDSPYNTYIYAGLPPGPINCPPRACLEAVLNPARHDYIFFCADAAFNGTHKFASTYSEHLENARDFQRALTARQKAAK